jgi:hypothetical protein
MAAEITADSRLPLVDIEAMEGAVGDALRAAPARLNIIAMMAHAKTCVLPQLNVGRAVMTEQSLPPLQREFLILLSARLDGCEYVWFGETGQALLSFGRQVIRGGDVDDGVFERVSRHFTAQEIVEAIIAIGYYMTMNRITLATRTPLEPVAAKAGMRK